MKFAVSTDNFNQNSYNQESFSRIAAGHSLLAIKLLFKAKS
jgi:hypothetical protein